MAQVRDLSCALFAVAPVLLGQPVQLAPTQSIALHLVNRKPDGSAFAHAQFAKLFVIFVYRKDDVGVRQRTVRHIEIDSMSGHDSFPRADRKAGPPRGDLSRKV